MNRSSGADVLCPNGARVHRAGLLLGLRRGHRRPGGHRGRRDPRLGRPIDPRPPGRGDRDRAGGGAAGACPTCGTPRSDSGDRFCEVCRYDFESGTPGPPPRRYLGAGRPDASRGAGPSAHGPAAADPSAGPAAGPAAGEPAVANPGAGPAAGPARVLEPTRPPAIHPPARPPAILARVARPPILPSQRALPPRLTLGLAPRLPGPGPLPPIRLRGQPGEWSVTIEIDPTLDVEPDPATPPPVGQHRAPVPHRPPGDADRQA